MDFDGDGAVDSLDVFPTDNTESADTDGDGLGDNHADPFPTDATNAADANWVTCAGEGQTCTVPSSAIVRFGYASDNFYQQVTESILCSGDIFGIPREGYKICSYLVSE